MIIKKFHKPFNYAFIKILSIILVLIFSFIFSLVFIAIFEINFNILNIILFASLITFVFLFFPYFSKNKWKSFYEKTTFQENLDFLPNEKIISKSKVCLIKSIFPFGYSLFPRRIIVTNFRIAFGFLNTLSLFHKGTFEEKMGFMNLWIKGIKKIPDTKSELYGIKSNSGFMKFLGSNPKIKDIAYGKNNKGEFIIIKPKNFPVYMKFNHPEAKLIYNSFK